MPKTRDEIEDLKAEWLKDGCWDIETTEGFEEHRDELLAYSLKVSEQGRQKLLKARQQFADELGISPTWGLLDYLQRLRDRIDTLENEMEKLTR